MARGNVEMVNCRALKIEMTVKACVVSNSTPARVIVRKRKNGAMMEVDGLRTNIIEPNRPDFLISFISSPFMVRILSRKGFSQPDILISLMELISSDILATLRSITWTTF